MFERIKVSCGCGCEFDVNSLRFEIKDDLKCPNCMETLKEKELIAEALRLLKEAAYANKKITIHIS